MAVSEVHACSPRLQSSLLLLALLAANATHVVRAEDRVAADRPLSGDRKLVSRGGRFALGFFRPDGGAAGNWYLGIWYHNISDRTPVWVANRDRPVSDPTASRLTIAVDGNLVLLDASGALAWSTNSSTAVGEVNTNRNATVAAVLLDTGNLVLAPSTNASNVLWQSFDHTSDTLLPGAKLRRDKVTGVLQKMTSWRSLEDPGPGPYTLHLDPAGTPQYVLVWNDTEEYYWTNGDWNGQVFTGAPELRFRFVDNDRESYLTYDFAGNSMVYRFVIDVSGQVNGLLWLEDTQVWKLVYEAPMMQCFVPQRCGAFAVCIEGASVPCYCATGFRPRDAARWSLGDYTGGCVRNAQLQCGKNSSNSAKEDMFSVMDYMRLRDNGRVAAGASSSVACERACLSDCTCSAFAYNSSCILWHGDLRNLGHYYYVEDGAVPGRSLYLRLAASDDLPGARSHRRRTVEIAVAEVLAIVCLMVTASVLIVRATMTARRQAKVQGLDEGCMASFKYRDLQSFTKNFSDKLGAGSFGSVFKGHLPDRTTAIAVKKLERLRQGEKQFRAEVSTLGTIQHVNLIRLLGFCSEGNNRKLLVYEYMPNGSLDRHLFFGNTLSWHARYCIAVGVAKGLSYLHDECRDRIIHCDIKPENILLDADFAPKVADFGLAKLVGRDFSRVLTTMRGTIGYLAPEWIGGEPITAKADVYSYGMMLFEIVSGRRNAEHGNTESARTGDTSSDHFASEFFPVLAARTLAEAEWDVTALLDPTLGGDADTEEVRRLCKVACWCIQEEVDARPTMAEVVQVLEGVTEVELPPVPRCLEILAGRWMQASYDYSYANCEACPRDELEFS